MTRRASIEDYASPGPMVGLEAEGTQDMDGSLVDHSEFYRLTPDEGGSALDAMAAMKATPPEVKP